MSVTPVPLNPPVSLVSNAHIYALMRFNQQCPPVYCDHENFGDIKLIAETDLKDAKLEKLILSKINLADGLNAKLTLEQQLATKYRHAGDFMDICRNDKKNEEVITTVFTESKLFKVKVKEFDINDFSDGGTYHRASNTMTILDKKPCNDAASTKRHELRHAFESTIGSNGDPVSAKNEVYYPFNNASEREELKAAIVKGDKFVTEHFQKLHMKAKSGKLKKGSSEEKEYSRLIKILENYKPRCLWREEFPPNFKFKKGMSVGVRYPMYLTTLFTTNKNAKVGMGTSVKDAQNNKVDAFIADVKLAMAEYPIVYKKRAIKFKKNPDDMITMERAAEIFSHDTSTVKAFYKEVFDYHVKREAKIAASLGKRKPLKKNKSKRHKKEPTEKIEHVSCRRGNANRSF